MTEQVQSKSANNFTATHYLLQACITQVTYFLKYIKETNVSATLRTCFHRCRSCWECQNLHIVNIHVWKIFPRWSGREGITKWYPVASFCSSSSYNISNHHQMAAQDSVASHQSQELSWAWQKKSNQQNFKWTKLPVSLISAPT